MERVVSVRLQCLCETELLVADWMGIGYLTSFRLAPWLVSEDGSRSGASAT